MFMTKRCSCWAEFWRGRKVATRFVNEYYKLFCLHKVLYRDSFTFFWDVIIKKLLTVKIPLEHSMRNGVCERLSKVLEPLRILRQLLGV